MSHKISCTYLAAMLIFLLPLASVVAQDKESPKPKKGSGTKDVKRPEGGTEAEQKMFHEVMDRLMQTSQVRDSYPKDFAWPPRAFIKPDSAREFNAYASAYGEKDEKGKIPAMVTITEGFLAGIIKGDPNVLAAIMGHELAHLIKKHNGNYRRDDLKFRAFSREQEIEADLEGVKIAVAANYPYQSGVKAFYRAWLQFGSSSNFEGLSSTHPTFIERLEILDRGKAHIWKAMAAFQNGYFFLNCEQYKTAETCFLSVVKEFPECAEAWANLGYARLMMYCDGLDDKDLKAFGIGQFVAGCFYARPEGIVVGRNADEKEWAAAVSALETALNLDGNLMLVRGNLGLAYLVHPQGKKVGKALAYLNKAAEEFDLGHTSISRAALMINHGVALQADGKLEAAAKIYDVARTLLPKPSRFVKAAVVTSQLELALIYNEAQIAAASKDEKLRTKAYGDLEVYLEVAPASTAWWTLAFNQYQKLGEELGQKPQTREQLVKYNRSKTPRVQASVEVSEGNHIVLSEGMDKALATLGRDSMEGIPIAPTLKKIKRYCDAAPGVDLLADHKVLAIFLTSDKAPSLFVQDAGVGSAKKKVSVGMPKAEFSAAMKDYFSEQRYIDNPTIEYQFFPDIGLGVRFAGDNVRELVLARIPRRGDRD